MDVVVTRNAGTAHIATPDGVRSVPAAELAGVVAALEREGPRWVWPDTSTVYPDLVRAGVRVARCHDLRLAHRILRNSTRVDPSASAAAAPRWDRDAPVEREPTLLDELESPEHITPAEAQEEWERHQRSVGAATGPAALRLLLAAESAGALAAVEMNLAGMPFDSATHLAKLRDLLGERPRFGARPSALEGLAEQIRAHLASPELNPDSQPSLLAAMRQAGIDVASTRKWALEAVEHPVREPLLEYRSLARLHSANGWVWMDTWVSAGRFRPDYVPGGVVTGRWAGRGGGALQLPHEVRDAVVADPGWRLVVADASQLEPRILAAVSGDTAMAAASRGRDLYQGLVDQKVVATRAAAKLAMLGAMYGATTGESGALLPSLRAAFPAAMATVENAAATGEAGRRVTTWLGRSSPVPGEQWASVQRAAARADAGPAEETAARRQARDWGRFTRNFVIQGSAAEWALCWLAGLRRTLHADAAEHPAAHKNSAHIVYFLHDEIVVHCPEQQAEQVAHRLQQCAQEAATLMFGPGSRGVEFPVTTSIVRRYADAH